MRALALIALGLLAGCDVPERIDPEGQVLACYKDGATTVRVEGDKLGMTAAVAPDGRVVETWMIRVGDAYNSAWYRHAAGPEEVCGPEPPKPG